MSLKRLLRFFAVAATVALGCIPLVGQTEVKEKPPMYTYVADWVFPRAQWAEVEKASPNAVLQKALASGTIVGYGTDETLVHQADAPTHDNWWSSMSMAGLMNTLDQIQAAGSASNPVMSSATKHSDEIFESRFYNYKAGNWKNLYGHGGFYKLKADAPDNAVEMLSKTLFVPFFEKLMADGTIYEYEIDTQAIHTSAPDTFVLVLSLLECRVSRQGKRGFDRMAENESAGRPDVRFHDRLQRPSR